MTSPCAVFMSASHKSPREFMQYVFKGRTLPEASNAEVTDSLERIPFDLDNKYYKASVDFCLAHRKDLIGEDFAEAVEAVILHFNNLAADGLEKASEWLTFVTAWEPSVQILACDTCSHDAEMNGVPRRAAEEWCIKHGFELVELMPEPDEEDDEDDDGPFGSSRGPDRILAALNAHTWSNLVLKDDKGSGQASAVPKPKESKASPSQTNELTPANGERSEEDGSSFEDLFEKFAEMKTACRAMSPETRRKYAEEVTMAFWNAINGDEDEIAGLDSDED